MFTKLSCLGYDYEILYLYIRTITDTTAPPLLVVLGRDGFHSPRLLPLTLFVVHGACVLRRDVQDVRLRHLRWQ